MHTAHLLDCVALGIHLQLIHHLRRTTGLQNCCFWINGSVGYWSVLVILFQNDLVLNSHGSAEP